MKALLIYILLSVTVSITFLSCAGYQVSYGSDFGVAHGPYGYGGYPRVNIGVYGGGYR